MLIESVPSALFAIPAPYVTQLLGERRVLDKVTMSLGGGDLQVILRRIRHGKSQSLLGTTFIARVIFRFHYQRRYRTVR